MNDRIRKELDEILKKRLGEMPGGGTEDNTLSVLLSISNKMINKEIKFTDPAMPVHITTAFYNVAEMIKGFQKENADADIIAGVLFAMLHDAKPCIDMYLYEYLEAYLDSLFHVVECEHLAGDKCEKGHNIERCADTEKPCPDRKVEYGTWSASLSCDTCPFRDKERH